MQEPACHENYPATTVIVANLVPLLIWVIGAFLLSRIGLPWALLYLLFVLALEFRLVSGHCRDCYYFGKTCAFGKGRLSALFFRRGSPEKFAHLKIGWKDLVPDFLLFLVPVIAGIVLLVWQFSWTIILLITVLLLLGFAGNAFVRGHLACRFCKQREIGCPAERLFDAKKPS
ncbi:hypothetical protein [Methanoregula formicica]|uniref:Uncharacterized protein n=1 Tax=Methanoregula formicica (strain DSM 22288 / NBRC 105244 / SMSP) TaxID=593750 RepID=L0HE95_METFS|nr:hypothetical protein [Methanoregula formicica]AGB02101.1 hypothetical protein Metfor_1052 [Methanoregula formicica SMSP]